LVVKVRYFFVVVKNSETVKFLSKQVYHRNTHPKFPEGGKMSQYLNEMKIGDTIDVKGPSGRLVYKGRGEFAIKPSPRAAPETVRPKQLSMIAGLYFSAQMLNCFFMFLG
jgi:Oxidoreductase FAD-binding domain